VSAICCFVVFVGVWCPAWRAVRRVIHCMLNRIEIGVVGFFLRGLCASELRLFFLGLASESVKASVKRQARRADSEAFRLPAGFFRRRCHQLIRVFGELVADDGLAVRCWSRNQAEAARHRLFSPISLPPGLEVGIHFTSFFAEVAKPSLSQMF